MSESIFEGKTVEEAIELACQELGLPREHLNIEIISTGSSGVFGLGLKKAKVRVSVPTPEAQPQPEEPGIEKADPKQILQELIALLDFDLTVESSIENGFEVLNLRGKDAGLLIGKQGQTINALQYLLNKMLSKVAGEKIQVVLDCEGYRERRKAYLTEMAMRLKERAQKTGRSFYTDLLNSADRRAIHLALQNDPVVKTKSIGDGLLKKVAVFARERGKAKGVSR